jgi:hypothetical protein
MGFLDVTLDLVDKLCHGRVLGFMVDISCRETQLIFLDLISFYFVLVFRLFWAEFALLND